MAQKSAGFDIFRAFATDPKKEVDGVRKEIAPGAHILVARVGHRAYEEAVSRMLEDNRAALDKGGAEAEKLNEELFIKLVAQHILVGFEGLAWKGKAAPYSTTTAEEMLREKEFRDYVLRISRDVENYRYDAEEAAAKN